MPDPNEGPDWSTSDRSLNEEFEYCATCGATLPKDEWCPVITETDPTGDLVVRSFCDEACKDAWAADGASADST